jgi:hypothetical protein
MSGITPSVAYFIGVPAIMLGSILVVGAIIGLITGRDEESQTDRAPQKKSRPQGLCRASAARGANAGHGEFQTTKAPYNNAGLLFNVGGDHSPRSAGVGPTGGPQS